MHLSLSSNTVSFLHTSPSQQQLKGSKLKFHSASKLNVQKLNVNYTKGHLMLQTLISIWTGFTCVNTMSHVTMSHTESAKKSSGKSGGCWERTHVWNQFQTCGLKCQNISATDHTINWARDVSHLHLCSAPFFNRIKCRRDWPSLRLWTQRLLLLWLGANM